MGNKVIAICGSPGSGKTLTAVKIAKTLADGKKNTILVGCDTESPVLPILLPAQKDVPSLGNLLALPVLTVPTVLQHCVPCGESDYIAVTGYGKGENVRTYPEYSLQRAKNFIAMLQKTADYAVIDCSSHITDDLLTVAALEKADITIRIANPNLKSISYFQSQGPLLQESRFHCAKQVSVINDILPTQDDAPIFEFFGNQAYKLPHVPELQEQFDSGSLLDTPFGKNAREYVRTLKIIVKEVIHDG